MELENRHAVLSLSHVSVAFIFLLRIASLRLLAVKNTLKTYNFFQRAFCAYCHDRIWGLGRQGFKCMKCKLLVHKKCHKLIRVPCDDRQVRELERELESKENVRGGSGARRFQGNGAACQEIMGKTIFFGGGVHLFKR